MSFLDISLQYSRDTCLLFKRFIKINNQCPNQSLGTCENFRNNNSPPVLTISRIVEKGNYSTQPRRNATDPVNIAS